MITCNNELINNSRKREKRLLYIVRIQGEVLNIPNPNDQAVSFCFISRKLFFCMRIANLLSVIDRFIQNIRGDSPSQYDIAFNIIKSR